MVGESGASAPVRQALRHLSTRMLIGAVPGLTPPDRSQRPHGSPALLLANLEKTCGSSGWFGTGRTAHAAKGVTVERRPHDSLGMVDESGSGTSTVAGDVVRLADPSSGRLQQ